MMKIFSVSEMQSLEKEANQCGLDYQTMMENAGKSIAEEINIAYRHLPNKRIVALVGSGNNGGDSLISLFYLSEDMWEICAYIIGKRPESDPLIERLTIKNGKVIYIDDDKNYSQLEQLLKSYSVLIDGILGTGIKLPLRDDIARILTFVNEQQTKSDRPLHVVAVDCPSGVDCDTGEVAPETIPAEITITLAGMKLGLIKFPAASYTGNIRYGQIGSISDLKSFIENKKFILDNELIKSFLPERPLDSHKGTFGTAYIVAGSLNFTGAALLAGLAAYRIGVGLVTMAVPAPLHNALSGGFPESTWILLPHEQGVISMDAVNILLKTINRASALLVGPGFGMEDTTREFIKGVLTSFREKRVDFGLIESEIKNIDNERSIKKPLVMDADGLKLLAKIDNWTDLLPPLTILTPHPGEMAILTGIPIDNIQEHRIEIAQEYSVKWGHIVVLKGAYTIIAGPDGRIGVVPVATPALAKAGTGDVLAGLIVGLLAQGTNAFQAACSGAWIHAYAGLLAAKRLGNNASVLASDVINAVPQVLSELL
jgi:ADP-dependent NAD(P)H-hydrate dehydratase / NAD(P)H-hydrate epimerase